MATGWYQTGLKQCLDGTIDLDTTTLKLILLSNTTAYTFNPDDDAVDTGGANDIVDAETNVSGYTRGWGNAGRKTVTITMQTDNANNQVDMAIADLTWTALGAGETLVAAVLIKEGGANDTTSIPIVYFDFTDTPTNGSDITLDFLALGSGGNMQFTAGTGLYQAGWMDIFNGTIDIDTTTLKVLLLSTATPYTYNADHTAADAGGNNDIVDAESAMTNYTRGWGNAGRKTATITLQVNDAANRVDIAIGDLTWTALGGASNETVDACVLVKEGVANDTTTRPIAYFGLADTLTNGGNFTLDFAALGSGGNIQLST